MKKILIIISKWPSKEHPYITYLISSLKSQFNGIELFMFAKGDLESGKQILGSLTCKQVLINAKYRFAFTYNPIKYIKPLIFILWNIKSSIFLYRMCRNKGYKLHQAIGQLVYSHSLLGKHYDLIYINALQSARHFCLKGLFPKTPIIASSRGQDFDFDPEGYDVVFDDINHLHVLSNYLKRKAIERGFAEACITIIPPAALPVKHPYKRLKKTTHADKTITIASASRLVWTKGYAYALRAIQIVVDRLPDYSICYHIIGDGPECEFLRTECKRLGIQKNVFFQGWLSQEAVNKEIANTDIYLLLSIEEGFNNSVLQAQNLGVPCVVSDAGGLPENVKSGVTGYVVPRYNVEAAATAIITLIQNPDLRKKMGMTASLRATKHFELGEQVSRYSSMFNYVMSQNVYSLCMQ